MQFKKVPKSGRTLITILLLLLLLAQLTLAVYANEVTVLEGIISINDTQNNISVNNGVVTLSASGGFFSQKTNSITIANESDNAVNLSFDYLASNYKNFSESSASGTYSITLAAGGSFTMSVTGKQAWSSNTATLTLSNFSYTVASDSVVTVQYDSSYCSNVTINGSAVSSATIGAGNSVSLAATVSSGTFLGWINADTHALLSTSTSCTFTPNGDISVQAVVIDSSITTPYFFVGSTATKTESMGLLGTGGTLTYYTVGSFVYLFDDLNEANNTAAADSKYKTIVLANNATLPAGDYTISNGVTLLIPFDSANTVYTTQAQYFETSVTYSTPTAYRTLTMASGATLSIDGAVSVSGKHRCAQGAASKNKYGGAPMGDVGFIQMETGSSIEVNYGGSLYVYGFITGSGSVTANSGASVYENFQLTDYRGGDVSTGSDIKPVFPVSQYYVQNIEVPLTLYSGAKEYGYTTVYVSGGYYGSGASFIGGDTAMFRFASENGYVFKWYDGTIDRMYLELHGDAAISSMDLKVSSSSINSAEYVLPVTSNITITIASNSNATIGQDIALLPGSQLIIEKDATVTVNSGIQIYAYDKDEWGAYCFSGVQFRQAPYAPSRTYTRTNADLVDASVQIDGIVDVSQGELYTTESGANIFSTGSGQIITKAGTLTTTTQVTQADTTVTPVSIPITPAQLRNGGAENKYYYTDQVYTSTANASTTTTYTCCDKCLMWYTGEHTCATVILLVDGEEASTYGTYFPIGTDLSKYYQNKDLTTAAPTSYDGSAITLYYPAVARIDNDYYETLENAAIAADNGDTVYLLRNSTVANPIEIAATRSFTVKLGGHSVTYTTNLFDVYGTLNLYAEKATIVNDSNNCSSISAIITRNGGVLNLDLGGGTIKWSAPTDTYTVDGLFAVIYNYKGGTNDIDLNGGTIAVDYNKAFTQDNKTTRLNTVYNNGTMNITDTAGKGVVTTNVMTNKAASSIASATGQTNYLSAALYNAGSGRLTIENAALSVTKQPDTKKGCSTCIYNHAGGSVGLTSVTLTNTIGYCLVNGAGTVSKIDNCSFTGYYGIYNYNSHSSNTLYKQGKIELIQDSYIYTSSKNAILNRGYIGTIIGTTEGAMTIHANGSDGYAIHNTDTPCYTGYEYTTATDDAGNTVKTYVWDNIPTINCITGYVTISTKTRNTLVNQGVINEISGNVDILTKNASTTSSYSVVSVLNGGYIGEISGGATITAQCPRGIVLSGQRKATDTTDTSGTTTTTYASSSGIGAIREVTVIGAGYAIYCEGTIGELAEGLIAVSKGNTSHYAVYNNGTITKISGGYYYHASGRVNAISDPDNQSYPEGYTLSTDTFPVPASDGNVYNCYYLCAEEVAVSTWAANVVLGNNLDMMFAFPQSAMTNWTGCYVEAVRTYANGTAAETRYNYEGENKWETVNIGGENYYVVTYGGFAAKEMCDSISLMVCDSSGNCISTICTDSIQAYALRMLEKATDETNPNEKLQTVIVDMLNYGAACQTHFGYNKDNLANAKLSDEQKAYGTTENPTVTAISHDGFTTWYGANLVTESNIQFALAFSGLSEGSTVTYSFTGHKNNPVTNTVPYGKMYGTNTANPYIFIPELVVADANSVITVTVTTDTTTETWTESVASYVARNGTSAEGDVYYAFLKFANSAKEYLHNK